MVIQCIFARSKHHMQHEGAVSYRKLQTGYINNQYFPYKDYNYIE